jgi:hypothetical protein
MYRFGKKNAKKDALRGGEEDGDCTPQPLSAAGSYNALNTISDDVSSLGQSEMDVEFTQIMVGGECISSIECTWCFCQEALGVKLFCV